MKKMRTRIVALATLGALALTSFGRVAPAHAGSKGRKNVMLGAAAVTAYGLLKHRRGLAVAGAVGTGVAYHNYRAAKQRENREASYRSYLERQRYYNSRYSYNNGYNSYSGSGYSTRSHRTRYRHDNGRHRGFSHSRHRGYNRSLR